MLEEMVGLHEIYLQDPRIKSFDNVHLAIGQVHA